MGRAPRARAAHPRSRQVGGPFRGRLRGRARAARGRLRAGPRRRRGPPTPSATCSSGGREGIAGDMRALVARIVSALGVDAGVDVHEGDRTITVTCSGADVGLLIGTARADDRRGPVPAQRDRPSGAGRRAQGGRRRRGRLSRTPPGDARVAGGPDGAGRASRAARRVELEPMTAVERKVVHLRSRTTRASGRRSEGTEPNRYVVVLPARLDWLDGGPRDARPDGASRRPSRRARCLLDDALRAVAARGAVSTGRSSTSGPATARRESRSRSSLPDREVTLLEAERRKCDFLERWAPPNARVVWGRAEEQRTEASASRSRRRSRSRRWRPSGACRSSGPGVPRSSGSARAPTSRRWPLRRGFSAAARRRSTAASSSCGSSSRRRRASRAARGGEEATARSRDLQAAQQAIAALKASFDK